MKEHVSRQALPYQHSPPNHHGVAAYQVTRWLAPCLVYESPHHARAGTHISCQLAYLLLGTCVGWYVVTLTHEMYSTVRWLDTDYLPVTTVCTHLNKAY